MSIKVTDLTKNSKWKVISPIQSYRSSYPYVYEHRNDGNVIEIIDKRYIGPIIQQGTELVFKTKVANWGGKNTDENLGQILEFGIDDKNTFIAFKDVKDAIELLEQPDDIVYLIRDSVTGHYYKGDFSPWYGENDPRAVSSKAKGIFTDHAGHKDWNEWISGTNGQIGHYEPRSKPNQVLIEWSKTPGSGKVMKTLSQVKQRCMFIIGYYNDMGDNAPGMLYNGNCLNEVPSTWEIVAYNKVSKTHTVVQNVKEYLNGVLRLKNLTIKYGSAVRDLYNKLEKKGELDTFKGLMVFNTGVGIIDGGTYSNPNNMVEMTYSSNKHSHDGGYIYKIIDDEVKEVKSIVTKDMRKSFQTDSMAVAIKSVKEALVLKLTYTGKLNCTVIDMETLSEEVA